MRAKTSLWSMLLAVIALAGCAGSDDGTQKTIDEGMAPRNADGTIIDDRALCDFKGRKDVEVRETAGPGAIQPNVRRVYKVYGQGDDRRRVLICREVDTNLDGYKDTVRFYNDEGQSKEERADTNYDGRIDTWNVFANGRLAEIRLDKNHDGKPDEWKTYTKGKLNRIKRDTNYDTKPDTWEMYRKGRLERMGVDLNGDQRVDRWDHDTEWRKKLEAEKKAEEEKEAKESGEDGEEGDEGDEGDGEGGADDADAEETG